MAGSPQIAMTDAPPQPRAAEEMMSPRRLASFQPSRLSVSRALMNRMLRERWDIAIDRFDVDLEGAGTVVYSIRTPDREFSFIAFARPPSRKARTGRIIGQAWDMMGTLNEGPATEADIESARTELPKLYRGRATPNALVWCRSNRSMRVFDETLEALADGRQPKIEDLAQVCYLMRNTGLDGNGTFGTRAFPSLGADHPLGGPLQAQMLTAYLMREYSCDLIEHLARLKSQNAVPLNPSIRRYLGVGNGSALGLIFFVHRHPQLIASWIAAREEAITIARRLDAQTAGPLVGRLLGLVRRAIVFRRQDRMMYETFASSAEVATDLEEIERALVEFAETGQVAGIAHAYPFDALADLFDATLRPEACETYRSLLIELVPAEADALFAKVGGADEVTVTPTEHCGSLVETIRTQYRWALDTDMASPNAYKYVWYKSRSAEEPRRGARVEVPEALDLGLDICGGVQSLLADLGREDPDLSIARFLMKQPRHRHLVARIQTLRDACFHTPMANINDEAFVPIDLVRLMNVGIHGIDKTRDFLSRNLRGVLFHGAPTPADIRSGVAVDWAYPPEPRP